MTDTIEKRQRPRKAMVVRVDYPDAPGAVDWTEDISAGGVFIRTERPLAAGQSYRLILTFPGRAEPLALTATVVWVRTNGLRGVGVRIDSPQQLRQMADCLLQQSSLQPNAKPFRVIIAEDNPQLAEMWRRSLRQMAAVRDGTVQLSFFANGHDALNAANESFPDLVMTDINLPLMDGLTLIRKLRLHPSGSQIGILAMGAGQGDDEQLALKAGADAFLAKPFGIGQMTKEITDHLLARTQDGGLEPPEIVVIDDDADNVELLERVFSGHRVVSFTDPEKGLAASLSAHPKVMVVDYKMPKMDGVTLVELLRMKGESRCAVIVVTAFPDLDEVVYARQHLLFYRLVPKPIDPSFLRQQVESALEEYDRKNETLERFVKLTSEKS